MGIHCFSCAQNHTKDHHPFKAAHHCAPLTGTEKYKMWWKITPRGGRVIWLPDRPRGIFLRPPGELHMAAQLVAGKKRTGSNLHTKRDLQNFTSYLLESRRPSARRCWGQNISFSLYWICPLFCMKPGAGEMFHIQIRFSPVSTPE